MNIGFIGFGNQARENIIPACRSLFGVDVKAICDRDRSKLADAQEWFANIETFTDHREMMDSIDLDAVIVACYPTDHYHIAKDALERGISVFIEKPLAPSSAHVDSLISLAAQKGCTTGVGMNFRFAEVTRRLISIISDGPINSINLQQHANKPLVPLWDYSSLFRSFLHAQTIHGLDFLIHLCGPVRDIKLANSSHDQNIIFTVILEFHSGSHATLGTSNTSPHFVFDFNAICQDTIHISSSSLWDLSVSQVGRSYQDGETRKWRDQWRPSPLVSGFERSGYHGQLVEFLAAVKEGRDSSVSFASVRETYRCMDIIEQLSLQHYNKMEAKVAKNDSSRTSAKNYSKLEHQFLAR